uniref:Laminin subunit alpha n=1 Tax=Ditylenchus dipsaci TaxID=166011 RepID=A0A915EU80_9BILA
MRRLGRDDQHAWGIPSRRWVVLAVIFYLSNQLQPNDAVVLTPPNRNLAHGRKIEATFTCGEVNGQPISEIMLDGEGKYKEMMQKESFLRGGQNCDFCMANTSQAHPASNMRHAVPRDQHYHRFGARVSCGYVWIQMANSPRPGTWILEHSVDYGKTYQPWQYFASSPAECSRLFGIASLSPITEDDSVICTSEFSSIQPMDNGEIMLNLLENRPGKNNFGASKKLQTFAKATNVRIVLLKPKTLQGHLMDLHGDDTHHPHADATVTRRYFYGIKEVLMGGRCVCNGHADSCDVLDVSRPRTWLCRSVLSRRNGCPTTSLRSLLANLATVTATPKCVYEENLDENHQSLDIHGNYSGGGRCLNCRDNTEGINCNQCKAGYYRPENKEWTDPDVCQACVCDPTKHTGNCAEETGKCECLPQFTGPECDQCAEGYYHPPECRQCECNVNGTTGGECLPVDGKCPCKEGYSGTYCESCSPGYTNLTAGCPACKCDDTGSVNAECDVSTGQCACKSNFGGLQCNKCANGYFNHPACDYCDCDPSGTEDDICDQTSGQCLCKAGFSGRRCEQCDENYFGYPNCKECGCNAIGSKSQKCDATNGECPCHPNFTSRTCDRCAAKYYRYPECLECGCNSAGSKGVTCDNDGQCYCKPNFEGNHCDQCKENFITSHLRSGVIPEFAGCDKVAPGELCTCRENVIGRTCSQCKPTFWDLQPYHEKGCVDCNCNKTGTLSLLNSCDQVSGQCTCKRYVAGQKCDLCADGFYNMQANSQVGCQACNCDAGEPLEIAATRTLDSVVADPGFKDSSVTSPSKTTFSQLFGTIDTKQRKVVNQMESLSDSPLIQKSFRTFPGKAVLEPTAEPTSKFINTDEQPLVLNVGKWHMKIKSPKRLFLVGLRSACAVGVLPRLLLSERIQSPCSTNSPSNESCVELLYPPLPSISKVDASDPSVFQETDSKGQEATLQHVPDSQLPLHVGQAVMVHTDPDRSKEIRVELEVPEDDIYYLLVEYHNLEEVSVPVKVRIEQDDNQAAEGILLINHCPYVSFCREVLSSSGQAALVGLKKSPPNAKVTFVVQPGREFGIVSVNLIKEDDWSNDFLDQVAVCVRKDGVCVGQLYPQPANSIVTEAEAGPNMNYSISGDKLPFVTHDPSNIRVMSIDNAQSTLDVEGVVASPGKYVFVVHFFSPDNIPITTPVLVQNERFADAPCTTVLALLNYFHIDDKYTLTFYFNNSQKGPIYIDSVIAVPYESYSDSVLKPLPLDLSLEFAKACAEENFANHPEKVSEYCKNKIFSLTSDFNTAALPCECNPQGSLDFTCAEYGGQCKCKDNVIGRTCERCAPGYYNYPECIKCKCGNNQQCDERSGQCFCPRYVEGQLCDRCVKYAFGYDPLIGCQLCVCNNNGSNNGEMECDALSGQCLCKVNVGGRRCEKCLPGYYGFPHCYECNCEDKGTTHHICDVQSAKCLCKKNVVGEACNSCRAGTFDLRKSDVEGCSECFCFGVTDRCRSSQFPVQSLSFDDQSWKSDDLNGKVFGSFGRIVYTGSEDEEQLAKNVYLEVPIVSGKDYTTSYGLHLSFIISSYPSSDKARVNTAADVKMVAGDTTLEYWAPEQPSNLTRPFKVRRARLSSSTHDDTAETGENPHQSLLLRKPKKAVLEEFELETGEDDPRQDGLIKASSVELCECPPPYAGPSCQFCAPGYYRVSSGNFLGSCVPCNCHSHSGTCDPATGLCSECQHNTEGDHCESCVQGFYGNATTGSPSSCLRCACPYPSEANNFALSCFVSERGILERCVCKKGYSGDRCETCDVGFFGDPWQPGGTCQQCFCNENNDLKEDGSCNPKTGDCALCEGNTDGRKCEYCKDWYYGDAVSAKNCTECKCNQCGSRQCDNKSGQCECHALVEGKDCDTCVENAWGFDSCRGCRQCNCGVAASNSQCDLKTGQCACLPGAAGLYCERCEHGYWNYSPQGCKKCDCEADLSLGTVCDVNTGQCHCQEGASGPRCDSCIDTFLKVPKFGCRFCDECVFALNTEMDNFDISLEVLNSTLGNVSSVALTGSRLRKIQKAITDLDPALDKVISFDSDANELSELVPKIASVKDASSNVNIKANRTVEQLASLNQKLDSYFDLLKRLRLDTNDLIEVSNWQITKVVELKESFQNAAPVQNREQMIADAAQRLEEIKVNDDQTGLEALSEKLANVTHTLVRIEALKNKSQELFDQIKAERMSLQALTNSSIEFGIELHSTENMIKEVQKMIENLSLSRLKTLINGIEKDSSGRDKDIASTRRS